MTPRLYLIVPQTGAPENLLEALTSLIKEEDVACVLLEESDRQKLRVQINLIKNLCHTNNIAILVKNQVDLVKPLGADGVHITGCETEIKHARSVLGNDVNIGAEAQTSRHKAMLLGEAGADYITFSGPENKNVEEMCSWWTELFQIPCVACLPEITNSIKHKKHYDFYAITLKG